MSDNLVVILSADAEKAPDIAYVSEEGHVSDAKPNQSAARVIVILPQEKIIFLTVTLPHLARKAMPSALAFALEDALAEELENYHFVPSAFKSNEPIDVAVVAKRDMQVWLAQLSALNIVPDVGLPAALALPYHPETWAGQCTQSTLIRTSETNGFHCDTHNLTLCLNAALEKQATPRALNLCVDDETRITGDLPLPTQVNVLPAAEMRYCLIKQAVLASPLNLFTGEFRQRKRSTLKLWKQPWLKVGVIIWAALMMLYPIVSWQLLSSRADYLHAEMLAIYHRHFPETLQMIAPRERMEARLHQYAGGGSSHLFFNILMRVSRALHEVSGIQLKRLDYQNQIFTVAVTAQSPSVFSDWVRALQSSGLRVKQQNAELQGDRINATVTIQ